MTWRVKFTKTDISTFILRRQKKNVHGKWLSRSESSFLLPPFLHHSSLRLFFKFFFPPEILGDSEGRVECVRLVGVWTCVCVRFSAKKCVPVRLFRVCYVYWFPPYPPLVPHPPAPHTATVDAAAISNLFLFTFLLLLLDFAPFFVFGCLSLVKEYPFCYRIWNVSI
jgi:hypothetical protein